MSNYSRRDRAAQVIQRELARIIQQEVKDPRLPSFITVSAVKLSPDLRHAKVYVTALADDSDKEKGMLKRLNAMSGFIRSVLGSAVKMRVTPELHFVYDESVRHGSHMASKIDEAIARDEKQQSEDDE